MKDLIIDTRKNPMEDVPHNTAVLTSLKGSSAYAERANHITLYADRVTKEIYNHAISFTIAQYNAYYVIGGELVTFPQIEEQYTHQNVQRAWYRQDKEVRTKTYALAKEFSVPMEILSHIDDYIDHELLNEYDITIGQSLVYRDKSNTYKPTDLERKQWSISDRDFAFSRAKCACVYTYETTIYDKLVAYIALRYYVDNGINSDDYNNSRTGAITDKAITEACESCGHAPTLPLSASDTVQEFIDSDRFYRVCY